MAECWVTNWFSAKLIYVSDNLSQFTDMIVDIEVNCDAKVKNMVDCVENYLKWNKQKEIIDSSSVC